MRQASLKATLVWTATTETSHKALLAATLPVWASTTGTPTCGMSVRNASSHRCRLGMPPPDAQHLLCLGLMHVSKHQYCTAEYTAKCDTALLIGTTGTLCHTHTPTVTLTACWRTDHALLRKGKRSDRTANTL